MFARRQIGGAAFVLLIVPGAVAVHGTARPISFEQAAAVLLHAQDDPSCPPGTTKERNGGMFGNRTECVILRDSLFGSGWRFSYEPADDDHGSAFRSRYEANAHAHDQHKACQPRSGQKRFADWLVDQSRRTLMTRYMNNPWQALDDGFIAYPIPDAKWFHMVASSRIDDGPYVAPRNGRADPRSRVFNPAFVESFMYGMTDDGLTPFGAMYILPSEYKDWPPNALPNPTGCLLQWHNHTGAVGLASSFDLTHPDQSVWMSHVWTYGGLDPWGRDYDGSRPGKWFAGYRYIPAVCNDEGGCV